MSPTPRKKDPAPPADVVATEERTPPPNRPLWAIRPEVRELHEFLVSAEGIIPDDEAGAALTAWFDGVTLEHNAKLDAYAHLIGHFRAEAARQDAERAIAQAEADRYAARRDRAVKEAERLTGKLLEHLQGLGVTRHETGRHEFILRRAGGVTPLVRLEKVENMPLDVRKAERTLAHAGAAEDMVQERIGAAVAALRALGVEVSVDVTWKLDDAAARRSIDAALAARAARMARIEGLVDGLGMTREEAEAQEPPTEAEAVLAFIQYGERKVSLLIQ